MFASQSASTAETSSQARTMRIEPALAQRHGPRLAGATYTSSATIA